MLPMWASVRRFAHLVALAAVGALVLAGGGSAAPLVDHFGAVIPNTEAGGRADVPGNGIDGPINQVAAAGAQVPSLPSIVQPLGIPQTAAQPAGTGSPNSPEEDLAAALEAL